MLKLSISNAQIECFRMLKLSVLKSLVVSNLPKAVLICPFLCLEERRCMVWSGMVLVLVLVLVGVHALNRNSGIHTAGSEPAL